MAKLKVKKPRNRRDYTIADLIAIAQQLGGRIKFDVIPVEMINPSLLNPKDRPGRDEPKRKPR